MKREKEGMVHHSMNPTSPNKEPSACDANYYMCTFVCELTCYMASLNPFLIIIMTRHA